MAVSHICQHCGFDLAFTRPQRDPHYHLPLVTCPRCAHHSVRRMHPLNRGWNLLLRYDMVATIFFLQAFMFCITAAASIAVAISAREELLSGGRYQTIHYEQWIAMGLLFALLPLTIGAWLTVGFAHFTRWKVFLGWMCAVLALAFALLGMTMLGGYIYEEAIAVQAAGEALVAVLVGVPILTMLSVIGILPGLLLRRLVRIFRRVRWKRRKALRRKHRRSGRRIKVA